MSGDRGDFEAGRGCGPFGIAVLVAVLVVLIVVIRSRGGL